MSKMFTKWMMTLIMVFACISLTNAALVSDAGTASASEDSVCVNGNSTLVLTGYTGSIQWQSFDGTSWTDETNPGSTTDNYDVILTVTTDFRAVVTDIGFPPDTSNTVTITVGVSAPATTGATRCGYGPITMTASGGGSTFKWYDVATGGIPLYTGSSFTTNVASTTTFYVSSASAGGGSATAPMTTHSSTYTGYTRGYWFTAPSNFTITSLFVPTDASMDNQSIAVLLFPPGSPPVAGTAVLGFTTLYITQNNTATGPIPVSIPIQAGEHIVIIGNRGSDTVTDFGAINSYDGGAAFNTTIDGSTVALNRAGMQSNLTGFDPITTGLLIVVGTGQRGRVIFDYEVGCESIRTPVVATVTAADPIVISANPPALCQGQSSTITVSSNNANYSYTWSPSSGLSGTTGTSNIATPLSPITYTIIADDGICGAIDSVFMSVGPASVAGTATISSDTICAGTNAYLQLTGYTGNIQWQSFDGTNWVNETGPGSTTDNYAVSPSASTVYQAVITSGGCDPDTTVTLSLDVLTIIDPVTVNDTICDPGTVNLSASGAGLLNWYTTPTGGNSINTGTTYSPSLSATTTYYVQASAGGTYQVGPLNAGIGNQNNAAGNNNGLQFDVTQQATLEKVYVSAAATGTITINLRATQGGPILNTVTAPVTAFSGLVPVSLGFTVNPGTYRLEMAAGSVACYYNTTGAIYPYTAAGSPVTITGYVNPAFNTGGNYFYFYNWEVNQGCSSNRVPVTGVVGTTPLVPVIIQNGSLLTSTAPSNNQWNLNGTPIPGATATTYDMALTGAGSYTVTVTTAEGCSATSNPVIWTSLNESMAAAGISVYPNPVKDFIAVEFNKPAAGKTVASVYNSIGELVLSKQLSNQKTEIGFDFPAGIYSVEIRTNDAVYVTKVVKQ